MVKRIFFGLNLPEETKKEIFESYSKKIQSKELKIVKEKNLHITLLFLGYFAEEKIEEIKEKINEIQGEKFVLKIKGLGFFNSRIIFLKIIEGKKEVEELHQKICGLLEIKDERFSAHITIARNKKMKRNELDELIEKLKRISFEKKIEIKKVDLMESILSSSGPEYKIIKSFNL